MCDLCKKNNSTIRRLWNAHDIALNSNCRETDDDSAISLTRRKHLKIAKSNDCNVVEIYKHKSDGGAATAHSSSEGDGDGIESSCIQNGQY